MDAPEYTPTQADWSAVYRDFALARDSTNALVSVAAKPAPAAWRFYWRSEEKGMLLCSFTGMEFQALSLRGLRVRLQD